MDSQNQSNRLGDSFNEFAFELHRSLTNETSGNIFFSPFSLITALAMTYAGAKNNTADQMAKVLHFDKVKNIDSLHKAFENLNNELLKLDAPYILRSANRLYAQNDYTFLEKFLQKTQVHYKAGLVAVDFKNSTEAARASINSWVSEQTNNKINDLIPSGVFTPLTTLVLVNAIYFKGNWMKQFNKKYTYSQQFKVSPTKNLSVDLMFIKHTFPYYEDTTLKCQVLSIPYVGNNLNMVIVLPGISSSLKSLEDKINASVLSVWREKSTSRKVKVHVPRFKLEESFILNDQLTKMGMTDLFSAHDADLSGITGGRDLYVSSVVHKAFIEVNEEGSEAAAATAVVINQRSIEILPEFIADHPFIFFIHDNSSGSILFLGRVVEPTISQTKDEL